MRNFCLWCVFAVVAAPPVWAQEFEPGEEEEVIEDVGGEAGTVVKGDGQKNKPPVENPTPPTPTSSGKAKIARTVVSMGKATGAPASGGKQKLFVYIDADDSISPDAYVTVRDGVLAGIDPGFVAYDIESFAGPDKGIVLGELREADEGLRAAATSLQDFDLAGATTRLNRSVEVYEKWLPALLERDGGLGKLVEANVALATARILDADEAGAKEPLGRVFVLDPQLDPASAFPPDAAQSVVTMRQALLGQPLCKLEVNTTGGIARVLVNGRPAGKSPVKVDSLRPGPNYVTFLARNRPSSTVVVVLDPGAAAVLDYTLPEYGEDLLASARGAIGETGGRRGGAKMLALNETVGLPGNLLFIRARTSGELVHLDAQFYGIDEEAKLLNRAKGEADPTDAKSGSKDLARAASRQDALVGIEDEEGGGLMSHPYFWPAVGVAAAVVVTGVIVGVVVANQGLSPGERVVIFGYGF